MLRTLVFEYHVISYEQFVDNTYEYELTTMIRCLPYAVRQPWEQTRMMMWASLTPYTKKGKKLLPEDLFTLPTEQQDDPFNDPQRHVITDEQIAELKQQSIKFLATHNLDKI